MLFETVTNLPSSLPPTRQRLPWTCPCLPLGRSLQTRYSLKNSHPTENSTFSGKPASPGRLAPTSAPSHTMSSMFPEFKIPCLAFMAAIIIVKSWVLTASTWWHNQVCYNISRPTRANHLLSIQTVGRQVSGLHHSYLLRLLLQYTIQVYILALIPILFQRNPPAFLVLQSVVAGRTLLRKPLQHGSSERWRSDEVFSIQVFPPQASLRQLLVLHRPLAGPREEADEEGNVQTSIQPAHWSWRWRQTKFIMKRQSTPLLQRPHYHRPKQLGLHWCPRNLDWCPRARSPGLLSNCPHQILSDSPQFRCRLSSSKWSGTRSLCNPSEENSFNIKT